jgi:hypothetical protein
MDAHPSTDQRGATTDLCGSAVDTPGVYLTDEVFLYRVVGSVAAGGVDALVEVEDCYWLDVVPVAVSDLRSRRLRVVTALDG